MLEQLPMDTPITLNCLAVDDKAHILGDVFALDIPCRALVSRLKGEIKDKKAHDMRDVDADRLMLWKLSSPLPMNDDVEESNTAVTVRRSWRNSSSMQNQSPNGCIRCSRSI
jgi:hypothetical protein